MESIKSIIRPSLGNKGLIEMAKRGYAEIVVEDCLNEGVDVDIKHNNGQTALIVVVRDNHPKVVKVLLAHGADIDAKDKKGWTVLIWAVENNHAKVVKLLLEHGEM